MNKETEASADTWDTLTRFLHWVSAVWIMSLIGLGLVMVNLVDASGHKFELYQLHKSYGFVFGLLLAIRLFWKLLSQRPRPLDTGFMQKSATAN